MPTSYFESKDALLRLARKLLISPDIYCEIRPLSVLLFILDALALLHDVQLETQQDSHSLVGLGLQPASDASESRQSINTWLAYCREMYGFSTDSSPLGWTSPLPIHSIVSSLPITAEDIHAPFRSVKHCTIAALGWLISNVPSIKREDCEIWIPLPATHF